jgi:hypothetical protein
MRQHTLVLAVVAAISLTGCGTMPTASLNALLPAAPALQNAPIVAQAALTAPVAPAVTAPLISSNAASLVSAGAAQAAPLLNPSTLLFSDGGTLTDAQLQADAGDGYSIQAIMPSTPIGTAFDKTGTLRQTSTGFQFDVTSSFLVFFKKSTTTYDVTGPSAILTALASDANKKVEIEGMLNGTSVTAFSVDRELSFSFLTDWFTKGKIKGTVRDAGGNVMSGATVQATDNNGFEFTAITDNDGEFSIKHLNAGNYVLDISKSGYRDATGSTNVAKRHSVNAAAMLNPKTP